MAFIVQLFVYPNRLKLKEITGEGGLFVDRDTFKRADGRRFPVLFEEVAGGMAVWCPVQQNRHEFLPEGFGFCIKYVKITVDFNDPKILARIRKGRFTNRSETRTVSIRVTEQYESGKPLQVTVTASAPDFGTARAILRYIESGTFAYFKGSKQDRRPRKRGKNDRNRKNDRSRKDVPQTRTNRTARVR